MNNDTLIKISFDVFQQALGHFGPEKVKLILKPVYRHILNSEFNEETIDNIIDNVVNVMYRCDSITSLAERYKSEINEAYHLTPVFQQRRITRADIMSDKITSLITTTSNSDKPILDYACGDGRLGSLLSKKTGREVVGADIENFLAADTEIVPGTFVHSIVYDGKHLHDIADKSIGDAFIAYGLHHASGIDYQEQFDELYRVLDEDGCLHVLEISITDADGNTSVQKEDALRTHLIDFVCSNLLGTEPNFIPTIGNYYPAHKWNRHAHKSGFVTERIEHYPKDSMGETCFQITYRKPSFVERLQQEDSPNQQMVISV